MIKAVNKLMKFIEVLAVVLLGTAVLVIVAQIVWRYVLRSPLGWTEQVARAEFIWLVMIGIPAMFNRYITMSFDLILEKIRGKAQSIIKILIFLIGIGFCVFYFIASLELCIKTGNRMVPGIPIPYIALYSAQPVGAALLGMVLIKQLAETIQKMRRKEAE